MACSIGDKPKAAPAPGCVTSILPTFALGLAACIPLNCPVVLLIA